MKRPGDVSRRTGDGAFDSFFLLWIFVYASSAAAAGAAAIKGSLNPNPCIAVAFSSESVPSAICIGSSCSPTQRHSEQTDSLRLQTLDSHHRMRSEGSPLLHIPPLPLPPRLARACARAVTAGASHCGSWSFFFFLTRFGQR